MWFSFSIISLTLFTVYFTYKKINASWKGECIKLDHGSCKFKRARPLIGSPSALIGITSAKGIDYVLKREGWFDRVCKSLGVVKEHQVGNSEFDDLVFIVSDDVSLHQQLSENPILLSVISDIFSCVPDDSFLVKQIRHNSGCLWVKLGSHNEFTEEDIKRWAPIFAPLLEKLAEEIEAISDLSKPLWKRPKTYVSAIILGLSTAIAITGYLQFKRVLFSDQAYVIDESLIVTHAILISGACVLILAMLALCFLGRSSRTHLVLLEIILLVGFGAFFPSYSALDHLNRTYDSTAAQRFEVAVLDKNKVRSKKGGTRYYLYTDDWIGTNVNRQIRVPYTTYHESSIGSVLVLIQERGALGYRWLSLIMLTKGQGQMGSE